MNQTAHYAALPRGNKITDTGFFSWRNSHPFKIYIGLIQRAYFHEISLLSVSERCRFLLLFLPVIARLFIRLVRLATQNF